MLVVDFLRKHFIAYYLQWKHTNRQLTTAVNQFKVAGIADTDGQDTFSNNSDIAADDDNEQDFGEEGE